jgi:hypothetical protein
VSKVTPGSDLKLTHDRFSTSRYNILMRIFSLTAVFALALPLLGATGTRSQCKQACVRDYELCIKRAANKQGRKTCAVFRKSCNNGCPAK